MPRKKHAAAARHKQTVNARVVPDQEPLLGNVEASTQSNSFFGEGTFDELPISKSVKRALSEHNFTQLSEIQAKAIPPLLDGEDVVAAAPTGSGKTLAFLVPAIDLLQSVKFSPRNGVGVLVLAPTRELILQIYDVVEIVMKYVSQSKFVCVGGSSRKQEGYRLGKGVNVLITTPSRMHDHMQRAQDFVYHNIVTVTIDEADRVLMAGFDETLDEVLKWLPSSRQMALFSATQTVNVADLERVSLSKPVFVEVATKEGIATVQGLTQGYVVCCSGDRFCSLFSFLARNLEKKSMVFLCSCDSVAFFEDLLNYIDMPVWGLHTHKTPSDRKTAYYSFCKADKGILLCTDLAARGLDIPDVDWIVQYDPPASPKAYLHRVGRTARGALGIGHALLFLLPQNVKFLHHLRSHGIPIAEYSFASSEFSDILHLVKRTVKENFHIRTRAKRAYKSYLSAYTAHEYKSCFDVSKLDLSEVAKDFGFKSLPKVLKRKTRIKNDDSEDGPLRKSRRML